MIHRNELEKNLATKIEDVKIEMYRKEANGFQTRNEKTKLEFLRHLYGEALWKRHDRHEDDRKEINRNTIASRNIDDSPKAQNRFFLEE